MFQDYLLLDVLSSNSSSTESIVLSIVSIVIAFAVLILQMFSYQRGKPNLKFDKNYSVDFEPMVFFRTKLVRSSAHAKYDYIFVSHIKIYNLSSNPCVISRFTLSRNDSIAEYNSFTTIEDNYSFYQSDSYNLSESERPLINYKVAEQHINMPITIPAFGYAEGYLLFPTNAIISDGALMKISAYTATKKFSTTQTCARKYKGNWIDPLF